MASSCRYRMIREIGDSVVNNVPSSGVLSHYEIGEAPFRNVVEEVLFTDIGEFAGSVTVRMKLVRNSTASYLLFGGIFDRIVCVASI